MQDVDDKLAGAADVVRATYRHAYQMHGAIAAACAVADVRDDRVTIWSATRGRLPSAQHHRDVARPRRGRRAGDFRARPGLLRHQRRGHRVLRCGAAPKPRVTRSRASHAQGRDGVGKLRLRIRPRTARCARRGRQHRRVGPRVVEREQPRRPAGLRHAGQRRDRHARRLRGSCARAPEPSARADFGVRQRQNAAPSLRDRCVGGACGGTGTVSSERVLMHVVASPFWTGPLRSPWRLQTRSRTNRSSTRWRRACAPTPSSTGCSATSRCGCATW